MLTFFRLIEYTLEMATLIKKGDVIPFGKYEWRVLNVNADNALIITEHVIEQRAYDMKAKGITWEQCGLREYLNKEFYSNVFSADEQGRVLSTCLKNEDNQWFGTKGGNDTTDKIFLLSLEEVVSFFGDSGQLRGKNPNSKYFINDRYKPTRTAKFDGASSWWWLRSPGLYSSNAAHVYTGGSVHVCGHRVANVGGGVRPALFVGGVITQYFTEYPSAP
jgi:hypothetical protein